jgi:hypothetical protein
MFWALVDIIQWGGGGGGEKQKILTSGEMDRTHGPVVQETHTDQGEGEGGEGRGGVSGGISEK